MSARHIDPTDPDDLGPAYDNEWVTPSQGGTDLNALLDERFPDHEEDRDRRVLAWIYLVSGGAVTLGLVMLVGGLL
jgi:hypothetical protein